MIATPEQHATAVLAVLNAALNPGTKPRYAYDFDDVPSPRPAEYVEVSVTRRFGGEIREDGTTGTTGWRITARYVAKRVSDARLMQSKCTTALEDVPLMVAGELTTGPLFETSEVIAPDDGGYFTGLDAFTYTL
ncbi:hypothetical protein EFK50_01045 [Nocardioides marmoriginsengisoli]|uniref:DUF3168 domain-containing protein n=1 Tax=Nocardioides marmoriginsengisoli TaxID=661483 RepID=A0A3N0CTG6_9ACTN|nr:hypothetical protein [Nocardioides marmoriginsengisoli]RNL66243.1 hypothetical protein EFK50_01045 [Nocardioides marmoriginsengisoli]